jgi:MFS family permease
MAMAVFLGLTIGTLLGGAACDSYGRRLPILLTYLGIVLLLFFCLMSDGFLMLTIGKGVLGVCMGFGLPAANALICESCPSDHRSNIYCCSMVCFALGQMYAAGLMWILSPSLSFEVLNWRMMLGLGMILPGVLLILAFFFLLESSHWLVLQGREEDAKTGLMWMAACNGQSAKCKASIESWSDIDNEEDTKNGRPTPREDTPLVSKDESFIKRSCSQACVACSEQCDRYRALFQPLYRRTTIIMTFVCFATNLTYYGMIYGLPHTFKNLEHGAADEARSDAMSPAAGVFFAALFEIPGVFLAILLCLTISRRSTLTFSFAAAAFSLLCLCYAFFSGQMNTVGFWFVFGVKMFVACGFIISYLYLLEFYPTFCRATGLSFCMVTGRVGALISPFLYDSLALGEDGFIWFFVVIACVISMAAVFCIFLPFETKDAPLNDV